MVASTKKLVPIGKKYISDFRIRFEIFQARGACYAIRVPASERTVQSKFMSPTGQPVTRVFRDADGNIFEEADLHRGLVQGDKVVVVTADKAKQIAKSELALNRLTLTAHRRQDVERYIFPSDNNAYIFVPESPEDADVVDSFIGAMEFDPDLVLLGMCNFRNNEGLYRLSTWRGYLAVQRQLFPSELVPYEPYVGEQSAQKAQMMVKLLHKKTQPFEPESYRDAKLERQRVAAEMFDGYVPDSKPVVEPRVDLLAALTAMLEED